MKPQGRVYIGNDWSGWVYAVESNSARKFIRHIESLLADPSWDEADWDEQAAMLDKIAGECRASGILFNDDPNGSQYIDLDGLDADNDTIVWIGSSGDITTEFPLEPIAAALQGGGVWVPAKVVESGSWLDLEYFIMSNAFILDSRDWNGSLYVIGLTFDETEMDDGKVERYFEGGRLVVAEMKEERVVAAYYVPKEMLAACHLGKNPKTLFDEWFLGGIDGRSTAPEARRKSGGLRI